MLQRLDRLTQDEARITVAQTLGVVHGLVGNVKKIMEGAQCLLYYSHIFFKDLCMFRQAVRHQWTVFESIWVGVSRESIVTGADLWSKALFTMS